jgi:hypothetical protein
MKKTKKTTDDVDTKSNNNARPGYKKQQRTIRMQKKKQKTNDPDAQNNSGRSEYKEQPTIRDIKTHTHTQRAIRETKITTDDIDTNIRTASQNNEAETKESKPV